MRPGRIDPNVPMMVPGPPGEKAPMTQEEIWAQLAGQFGDAVAPLSESKGDRFAVVQGEKIAEVLPVSSRARTGWTSTTARTSRRWTGPRARSSRSSSTSIP